MPNALFSHYSLLLDLKEPWKVSDVELQVDHSRVEIHVEYGGSKTCCPRCAKACRVKDHAPQRQWRHLDAMNFETIIKARIPRSNCEDCGIKTVAVPWADKHSRFTLMFEGFAIAVLQAARSLDAGRQLLGLSWDSANTIIKRAVDRGLALRDDAEVTRAGIDEKSFLRGHSYITLLNDLDRGRVLNVVPERTEAACRDLLMKGLPTDWSRFKVEAVAMDLWPAFRSATEELLENADIVYDRYHISAYLGEAVDQVRRAEHKVLLAARGDQSLTGARYSLLRSESTRTEDHKNILNQLCGGNLKTSRAWALKESFQEFWNARNEGFVEGIFRDWYCWAVRCQLKPMVKVAKILKRHLDGLMNYFKHRITNAVSEGINSKIQAIKASARGFRSFENYRYRILFCCGKLALSPKIAH
ncbi:ISL3 family transposase [Akkermansiaceae bacterium]|nr:ISL3 family transposase [Akkermansiaceae bacterium]